MHAAERRAAILRAAAGLFAERGFRGTTTRDLAAACGVSEPVLYEHFANKRDLFTAIVEWKGQEGFERFQALVGPYLEMKDDRRVFEGLAQLILEFYADQLENVRLLLFSALEGHEIGAFSYSRHREAMQSLVVRYIERRIEEGAFRSLDPALAARAFVAMIAHYGWSSAIFGCGIPHLSRDQIIQGMVSVFLDGVRAPCRACQRTEGRRKPPAARKKNRSGNR